jgi:hypothetical protein
VLLDPQHRWGQSVQIIFSILFSFLLSTNTTFAQQKSMQDIMNPQKTPIEGLFFEGWYHRVVDRKNQITIAAIATVYKPLSPNQLKSLNRKHNKLAFIGLFIQKKGQAPQLVQVKDQPARLVKTSTGYFMKIPNFGFISENELQLNVDNVKIAMQWNPLERNPWPRSPLTGLETPEDFAALIQMIPVHWHVHDMGSRASYEFSDSSEMIASEGDFHHEKNWGQIFPKKWYWLDAMDSTQGVYVSGAGGQLDLGLVSPPAFLLAIKTPEVTINFSPAQLGALYNISTNNCDQFSITGFHAGYKFTVESKAAQKSFRLLWVPTKDGYLPGASESLDASLRVRVWKLGPLSYLGLEGPISDYTIQQTGLEFGGVSQSACQKK